MNKGLLAVRVLLIVIFVVSIPLSRISETRRIYTQETRTVADTLCPPPIVAYMEAGDYHIRTYAAFGGQSYQTRFSVPQGDSSRIVIYAQDSSLVYQGLVPLQGGFQDYDFQVPSSAVYNATVINVWDLKVEITTTKNVPSDVVVYPLEPVLWAGSLLAVIGALAAVFSFVIRKTSARGCRLIARQRVAKFRQK